MRFFILCAALIFVGSITPSAAADTPELQAFIEAVEKQRQTYRALPKQWAEAEKSQVVVQKLYSKAAENVAACRKKSAWQSLFKDAFSNLEKNRQELEKVLKEADRVRIIATNALENQDVKRLALEAKFAGRQHDLEYWMEFSNVTTSVMEKYYTPMQIVLLSYKDYQTGFTQLSKAMNGVARDCRKPIPKQAVKKFLDEIDIFGKVATLIGGRLFPFLM